MNQIPIPIPRPKKSNSRDSGSAWARFAFLSAAIFAGGFFAFGINQAQAGFENFLYAQIGKPLEEMTFVTPRKTVIPQIELDAKAALVIRMTPNGHERDIFSRNPDLSLPIASLTKLMTAVVVFDHPEIYDLNKRVVIDREAAIQDDVPVSGNLDYGQTITVGDLLNKMLFYSSNDAAFALSEIMGKDRFIVEMNKKASALNLKNSIFYNPSGLDVPGGLANRSSAADIFVLLKTILRDYPGIFEIALRPNPYLPENGLFNLNFWDGQKLVGGKTGFTELAGGCMAVIVEDHNRGRYIYILLGSTSPETRVVEMQKLINSVNNADVSGIN